MDKLTIMTDPNDSDRAIAIFQKNGLSNIQSREDLLLEIVTLLNLDPDDFNVLIKDERGDWVVCNEHLEKKTKELKWTN